jgi:hypothetical protein
MEYQDELKLTVKAIADLVLKGGELTIRLKITDINEKKAVSAPKKAIVEDAEGKLKYGEEGNVKLTFTEFAELRKRLGDKAATDMILRLDRYASISPKRFGEYKSHYHVLLTWAGKPGAYSEIRDNPLQTQKTRYE